MMELALASVIGVLTAGGVYLVLRSRSFAARSAPTTNNSRWRPRMRAAASPSRRRSLTQRVLPAT